MGDPLKVALLTGKMSPAAGGLGVSVPGLAFGVDAFDDIDMHVFGTQDPNDPMAARNWGPRVTSFRATKPVALQRAPAMAKALADLQPDLVDVQGLWTWASKVSLDHFKRTQTPYIVTPRGMLDPWARRNSAWKKRLFAAFAENAHLRAARCLRATSELEASHFRDIGLINPIAIVANGIDLPDLAEREIQPLRTLLFISRIHPKKGLSFLLNSWEAVYQDYPDWQLIIAGIDEGGHEAELKRMANDKHLKRIHFVGAVHGAQKQKLYRNADVFILPSHGENFGLVIAEALAQETPVITTTNTPWSGLKTHACGWSIELEQTKLNDTLRHALMQKPAALQIMGKRGRKWVRDDFSAEQVSVKMREIYLWAAGHRARPDHVDG